MELRRPAPFLVLLCIGLLSQVSLSSSSSSSPSSSAEVDAEFAVKMYETYQDVLGHGEKAASRLRDVQVEEMTRMQRLLAGVTPHISYGSLRADSVRCPPMSGRSYYLPDCRTATGPVNPYDRGCVALTRCGRDTA